MSLRSTFTAASIRGWQVPKVGPVLSSVLLNPTATDIQFGRRVKLSYDGNYLIVGSTAGAWIYKRDATTYNNAWALQQQLPTPPGATTFGYSVDINIDGTMAVVGDPGWNSNLGRVSTFMRTGTTWSSVANITATATANAKFGREVSFSVLGNSFVSTYDAGGGYLYICSTTAVLGANLLSYIPTTTVTSIGTKILTAGNNGQLYFQDNAAGVLSTYASMVTTSFSIQSMAYSQDALYAIHSDGATGGSSGRVFVFTPANSPSVALQATLTPSPLLPSAKFGFSLDINVDGSTLVSGSLENAASWVGANGVTFTGSNSTTSAVYVYRRVGTTWTQSAIISSGTGLIEGFGVSVSIDKNNSRYIAVGSPAATPAAGQNVRLYYYNGTTWSNNIT